MPRKSKRRVAASDEHDSDVASGIGGHGSNEADASSVASHGSVVSGAGAVVEGCSTGADSEEPDEQSADVILQDKLVECIDKLVEKSLQDRLSALKGICSAMANKYMADFLVDRKLTIADGLERIIKRGKGEERAWAAKAAALLCAQLGADGADCETFYTQQLRPTLIFALEDESATLASRTAFAEALGVCGFITSEDPHLVDEVIDKCEALVFRSCSSKDLSPEVAALSSTALQSCCLLFTVSTAATVRSRLKSIRKFRDLLESSSVELRIAGGEAIALMHELAQEMDVDLHGIDDLCDILRELLSDSSKFRAKKDRRQQRSSLRDVLKALEEGESLELEYKFGAETLYIDSWARKRQYDAFCNIMTSGMNAHLQENLLLREIFGLGSPLPVGPLVKISKNDKRLYNAAVFKARTKARQKFRDKRVANISG